MQAAYELARQAVLHLRLARATVDLAKSTGSADLPAFLAHFDVAIILSRNALAAYCTLANKSVEQKIADVHARDLDAFYVAWKVHNLVVRAAWERVHVALKRSKKLGPMSDFAPFCTSFVEFVRVRRVSAIFVRACTVGGDMPPEAKKHILDTPSLCTGTGGEDSAGDTPPVAKKRKRGED